MRFSGSREEQKWGLPFLFSTQVNVFISVNPGLPFLEIELKWWTIVDFKKKLRIYAIENEDNL